MLTILNVCAILHRIMQSYDSYLNHINLYIYTSISILFIHIIWNKHNTITTIVAASILQLQLIKFRTEMTSINIDMCLICTLIGGACQPHIDFPCVSALVFLRPARSTAGTDHSWILAQLPFIGPGVLGCGSECVSITRGVKRHALQL